MEAKQDRVVSIIYELRKNDINGEIIENLSIDHPLTFIFGKRQLLPKFEDNLRGRKVGESFSFLLECEDAYGPVQSNAIIDLPINTFEIDGKPDLNILQIGNIVPMMDNNGRRLNGVIKKIGIETVTMDFNHPMAGQDLYFKGEITGIREATEEELAHEHIHSGNNCDSCGDNVCNSRKSSDKGNGCGH